MSVSDHEHRSKWTTIEIWADTSWKTPYILMVVKRCNGEYERISELYASESNQG